MKLVYHRRDAPKHQTHVKISYLTTAYDCQDSANVEVAKKPRGASLSKVEVSFDLIPHNPYSIPAIAPGNRSKVVNPALQLQSQGSQFPTHTPS
ncbi:hypothetical protein M8J76_010299 [Diaphorina citri]|nr:hypothetical protein M8J76_010299 [Diaphorina citri]